MRVTTVNKLKENLVPGKVYRRADLVKWSKCVDRHLQVLLKEGTLKKLRGGLYYYPKNSKYGQLPALEKELVRSFLKDSKFLITSPNAYNSLGVGLTQLYNKRVVYNYKRNGSFMLGGQLYEFKVRHFPSDFVSEEFALVDLVNNLKTLGEDSELILKRVQIKVQTMDQDKLKNAVEGFALTKTKYYFDSFLNVS